MIHMLRGVVYDMHTAFEAVGARVMRTCLTDSTVPVPVSAAIQRVLSAYAGELLKRLPKTAAGGTSAQQPYGGTDWHVRLPEEEEAVLTCILATAEYCRWANGGGRGCLGMSNPLYVIHGLTDKDKRDMAHQTRRRFWCYIGCWCARVCWCGSTQ